MTFEETKEHHIGEKVHPNIDPPDKSALDELGNLTIKRISFDRVNKKATFKCNDGNTYSQEDVDWAKGTPLTIKEVLGGDGLLNL